MKGVILFLLIVIAAAVFAVMHVKEKRLAERREQYVLNEHRKEAATLLEDAQAIRTAAERQMEQAQKLTESAGRDIQYVLAAQPPAIEPAPEPLPAPAAPSTTPETRRPDPPPPPKPVDRGGLPEGMPTREELEARRRGAAEQAQAPRPAPDTPRAAQEESPPAPPPPSRPRRPVVSEPPIQKAANELQKTIKTMEDRFSDLVVWAGIVRDLKMEADAAFFSSQAAEKVKEIQSQLPRGQDLLTQMGTWLDQVREQVDQVHDLRVAFDREQAQRREDAARRQAEREHQEQLAREKTYVAELQKEQRELIKTHRFAEALAGAEARKTRVQTDAAKAECEVLIQRYQRLMDLQRFLISRINADPYRWGWIQDLPSQKDILSADEQGVTLTGGQRVAWQQVSPAQMYKLFSHYLAHPNVSLRDQAEQHLSAAIYCQELGAEQQTRALTGKAIQLRPDVSETARALRLR